MVKDIKAVARASNINKRVSKSKWVIPQALKTAIITHPQWPKIRAGDWQQIAIEVLSLDGKLKRDDRRYDLINQFCHNERKRQAKHDPAKGTKHDDEQQAESAPRPVMIVTGQDLYDPDHDQLMKEEDEEGRVDDANKLTAAERAELEQLREKVIEQ